MKKLLLLALVLLGSPVWAQPAAPYPVPGYQKSVGLSIGPLQLNWGTSYTAPMMAAPMMMAPAVVPVVYVPPAPVVAYPAPAPVYVAPNHRPVEVDRRHHHYPEHDH